MRRCHIFAVVIISPSVINFLPATFQRWLAGLYLNIHLERRQACKNFCKSLPQQLVRDESSAPPAGETFWGRCPVDDNATPEQLPRRS